jgi:hypothetical protein
VLATEEGRALWARRREALCHIEERVLGTLGDDAPRFRAMLHALATNTGAPETNACQVIEELRGPAATTR